jgi:hypothetical protein
LLVEGLVSDVELLVSDLLSEALPSLGFAFDSDLEAPSLESELDAVSALELGFDEP